MVMWARDYATICDNIVEEATYICETGCTVREAAKHFDISKSKIYSDCAIKLEEIARHQPKYKKLYNKVRKVMKNNASTRHLHGGAATKAKYDKIRNENKSNIENEDEYL